MVYDATGERILKKEGTLTTLSVAGTELSVDATSGAVSATRYYEYGGQTVATRTGNTNADLFTVITDHQGSAHHQIRNSDSRLVTTWQGPFGVSRGSAASSWVGQRGFVGGTNDATGLVRLGARDYDPLLGKFLTVDPLQDLGDPLQWNAYIYANNSPVTRSDPSGLMDKPAPPPGRGVGTLPNPPRKVVKPEKPKVHPVKPTPTKPKRKPAPHRSDPPRSHPTPTPPAPSRPKPPGNPLLLGMWEDIGHGLLDVGGLFPGVGEIFDGLNSIWYFAEGNVVDGGLSVAGCVPFVGWFATGAKWIRKIFKIGEAVAPVMKTGEAVVPVAKSVQLPVVVGDKVSKQMTKRGWTQNDIESLVNSPTKTVPTRDTRWLPDGSKVDDPATGFVDESGHYVVRNDKTGDIVQVSDKTDPGWKAPWDAPR